MDFFKSTPKHHQYEDPKSLIKSATISRFSEKYDQPAGYSASTLTLGPRRNPSYTYDDPNVVIRAKSNVSPTRNKMKLRSSKSMGALNGTPAEKVNPKGILDETEISQVELFFRSHKSYVYVCKCLANLYFTKTDLINGGRVSSPRSHEWELNRTGIPLIIFDMGDTKARDKRQLQICLAERGTGFILWRDLIDNLTDYKELHPCFHSLYLSNDHRKMAGLSFDNSDAAGEFLAEIESKTSDPLNIALSVPRKPSRKEKKLKKSTKLPKKCDISSPCLFQHVTSVDITDFDRLYSLSTLLHETGGSFLMAHDGHSTLRRSSTNVSSNSSHHSSSTSNYQVPPLPAMGTTYERISSVMSSPSPAISSSSASTGSSENSSNLSL